MIFPHKDIIMYKKFAQGFKLGQCSRLKYFQRVRVDKHIEKQEPHTE